MSSGEWGRNRKFSRKSPTTSQFLPPESPRPKNPTHPTTSTKKDYSSNKHANKIARMSSRNYIPSKFTKASWAKSTFRTYAQGCRGTRKIWMLEGTFPVKWMKKFRSRLIEKARPLLWEMPLNRGSKRPMPKLTEPYTIWSKMASWPTLVSVPNLAAPSEKPAFSDATL